MPSIPSPRSLLTPGRASTRGPGRGPSTTGTGRLGVLDGLRLVAALTVVSYHFIAQGDTAWQRDSRSMFPVADAITSYGWLGVELFFIISGFVICMSGWGRPVGDFIVSRVVRLYPAYWFAVIAITTAVTISPVLQTRLISSEILVNLTMLQYPVGLPGASAVFWTLWNELHFYILFGVVVAMGTTYRRVVGFCGLWTIASVYAEATRDPMLNWFVDQRYSPFFIAGVLLYLMHRFRPTALLWGMLGVSWALAMLNTVNLTRDAKTAVGHSLGWRPTAFIVTGCFVVVAAAVLWPRLTRIHARWLTVAGALTYPLYLLHLEIGWLLIRQLHRHIPVWPLLAGVTAAMLLLSYLVNRFVERPAARLMRRLLRESLADLRAADAAPVRAAIGAGTGRTAPEPVGPGQAQAGFVPVGQTDSGRADADAPPSDEDLRRLRIVDVVRPVSIGRYRVGVRRPVRIYREAEVRRPRVTTGQRGMHP
jgi:peptidoglycan/LPS O-acetylase OafA/YrhL